MKKAIVVCMLACIFSVAHAAVGDTVLAEQNIRVKILNDIQQSLARKSMVVDSTIGKLDGRVGKLDSMIRNTGNPRERIDKLVERVQVLEEKQKAIEQNELNVYEANYQSAIINLVSMDREIKPLTLFRSTREFFNALTETSNPENYTGFTAGFAKFKEYVDKVKDHNAMQKEVSEIVQATGNVSFGLPIAGAYTQLLFTGMADYINSIGHNKRELKKDAEHMFAITTALSQFTTDKNQIEIEWDGITQSLGEMQVFYDSTLNRNLAMLGIDRRDMVNNYSHECDASRRYLYLTQLRRQAADYVLAQKNKDGKNWKENIYYQLTDVQQIKTRYGDITYHIKGHMDKYSKLIAKYKTNKDIGDHVRLLEEKLNQLKATFDDAFEPAEYMHSAARMYKVI